MCVCVGLVSVPAPAVVHILHNRPAVVPSPGGEEARE